MKLICYESKTMTRIARFIIERKFEVARLLRGKRSFHRILKEGEERRDTRRKMFSDQLIEN